MLMGMNRVPVAAIIVHHQPIALALLDGEQRIRIRSRLTVDGPPIIAAAAAWDFLECQPDRREPLAQHAQISCNPSLPSRALASAAHPDACAAHTEMIHQGKRRSAMRLNYNEGK
jgi:hypothetical protein